MPSKAVPSALASTCTFTLPRPHAPRAFAIDTSKADADVEDYLRTLVAQVRAGAFDDALVYRKGLRKSLASYTDSTPPHVAAARKLAGDPGRLIAYVMTTAGPEPVSDVRHPLDREHYIERQVRPVAEPVLALRGTSFDRVQGQPRQIDLF